MNRVLNQHLIERPRGAVFIGRPSKWGNPEELRSEGQRVPLLGDFMRYLARKPELLKAIPELRGRDLVCFCAPLPCHGDVLLALANKKPIPLWFTNVEKEWTILQQAFVDANKET